MISSYEEFAKELYRTKLTVSGAEPNSDNQVLLKMFANKIGELRPKLRSELYELQDEFLKMKQGVTEDERKEIEMINEHFIDKLRTYHKKLLKQVVI